VVAAKTGEASRRAESAIIVVFIKNPHQFVSMRKHDTDILMRL
jgi:hypothetical protein